MRIAVVGGGPAGLFFATLLGAADRGHSITVYERNRADDTYGFGVVFSDRTLATIDDADPVLREALTAHGRHWDAIEVRLKGERLRCGGMGMAAITRHALLRLLQERAAAAGADLRFSSEVQLGDLDDHDLVVAADGTGSRLRTAIEDRLGAHVTTASAKFIWFGTDYVFDGLTFVHERGPHGVFAVHGYPIGDSLSTFLVEADEPTWRAAELDAFDTGRPPGESDMRSKAYLEELFAEQIDGCRLLDNNSRWGSFRTRRTDRWHARHGSTPVVFLGDAVHTAHFSVGSGTKMAMEDAIALSGALQQHPGDVDGALTAFEAAARPSVEAVQASARPSLSWWEHFGTYHDTFEPWQFAYHFLTRSLSDARLARRDAEFVRGAHESWASRHGAPPLRTALEVREWRSGGRVVTVDPADPVVARTPDGCALPLRSAGAQGWSPDDGAWAAVVTAPDDEADLPAVHAAMAEAVAAGAPAIAVRGGGPLPRVLVCERARMHHGVVALLVDGDVDADAATTLVLSGRADAVGVPPGEVGMVRSDRTDAPAQAG